MFAAAHEPLSDQIIEGELDYVFLRPVNAFFFYAFYRIDIPSILNLAAAVVVQSYFMIQIGASIQTVIGVILCIFAGICFLFLMNQSVTMVAFWKGRANKITGVPEYLVDASTRPRGVYPGWVRFVFSWILPVLTAINLPMEFAKGIVNPAELTWYLIFMVLLL